MCPCPMIKCVVGKSILFWVSVETSSHAYLFGSQWSIDMENVIPLKPILPCLVDCFNVYVYEAKKLLYHTILTEL